MKLDSLTLYKDWLECLDTKSVQCRSTVQHNRMLFDYFFQNVPYFRLKSFYHLLSIFDIVCCSILNQFFHNEWFEQLDCHFFWQTTLVDLKFRSYDDNGTSRVVNTLTKQVLTETSGFTFQHIGQRFQSTVTRSGYRSSSSTVIDQSIYCFLKHTFFVSDDNIRCSKLQQSLQTVVTIDDSSVQVVQVRSCKSSSVQLYHRTQIRRNNRDNSHDHPLRTVAGLTECFYNFQSLDDSCTFLSGSFF